MKINLKVRFKNPVFLADGYPGTRYICLHRPRSGRSCAGGERGHDC